MPKSQAGSVSDRKIRGMEKILGVLRKRLGRIERRMPHPAKEKQSPKYSKSLIEEIIVPELSLLKDKK
ncbi:MAG: hypothetical protein HY394_01655 [Candidatus Diapherotrites archaeon]|nr:hypothetical protein [Candidatus Diapherotrites archaeon]